MSDTYLLHPAIRELVRMMPPAGSVWPREKMAIWLQAFDATICLIYGGTPMLIWVGEDGEIHTAAGLCKHNIEREKCGLCHDESHAARDEGKKDA